MDETVQNTIRDWRMQSVPTRFAGLMNEFRKYAVKNGMAWSDLIFLVGESKETSATARAVKQFCCVQPFSV
jgi:hypothetical protein